MTEDVNEAQFVRDGSGGLWEVEKVILPASWSSALVNSEFSGLDADPKDAAACRTWITEAAEDGWRVIDVARGEDGDATESWFSSSAGLYGSPYSGADLLTYVRERRVGEGAGR